jgi:hypothetical protein
MCHGAKKGDKKAHKLQCDRAGCMERVARIYLIQHYYYVVLLLI